MRGSSNRCNRELGSCEGQVTDVSEQGSYEYQVTEQGSCVDQVT